VFDLRLLGNKLSRCRQRLEYSYREIHDNTGISEERIVAFEKGELEPTGDEVLILADFYKEDYKYFISNQQKSASENTDVLYRKYGTEFSKYDKRTIQEFLFLCECEQDVWELLEESPKVFSPKKEGDYYKGHGEQGASDLRKFLGYSDNELLQNLFEDFRKIGIHIFRRKLSNSKISGIFILHPKAGKCVLVNYSEDLYRQNFTVAHEVAHSVFDTDDTFNVSFSKDGYDMKEVRANTFAANFLIPSKALISLKVNTWSIEMIIKVAEQLKVNVITLLYRLKDLNFIDKSQFENCKATRVEGSHKKDPELEGLTDRLKDNKSILLEMGLSASYIRKCHEVYSHKLISRGRLAEMLLTDEFELAELLGLFNLKLIYEH